MTKAEAHFNKITDGIPDVKPGKMFGAVCLKAKNGKAAAMFWKDELVIKFNDKTWKKPSNFRGQNFSIRWTAGL